MNTYIFPSGTGWNEWEWPQPQQPQQDWSWIQWYSCPNCGKLVQWGSIYCSSCGYKLIQEETTEDKLQKIIQKLEEILTAIQSLQKNE